MATDPASVAVSANSTATPAPRTQAPPPRALSCVLCAQRRVKCNKQQPCTNCTKARVECVPTIPNRSRRRRRRADGAEEDLLARCKRYERLLLSYGATKEVLDTSDTPPTMRSSDFKSLDITAKSPSDAESAASSHLAAPPGKNSLWVSLSDEILEISDDDLLQPTPEAIYINEDDIGFVFESYPSRASLILPHPKPVLVFQLWQVFVDNVNPLTKILHVPTFQKQLLAAMGDLENIPNTTEALLFSIYANAINSLSDSQCKTMMGESKPILLTTYLSATQRAMTNAGLLKTVDVDLLRALVLYTICLRGKFDPQALCIFTGMAVRMAHRLGIHREDVLSKSTIFEAELRRRIWWQIITLEMHIAERAGVVTFSPRSWDTNIPTNINDENLDPDMRELPTEYVGTTEMCFTLIKCEATTFTLKTPALCGNPQYFTNPDVPISVKEAVINDFKGTLEKKFVQYLDPFIPFHAMCRAAVLGITTRMLLMCLHPRQYTDRDTNLPLTEKEKLFNLCLNLAIEENLLRANNFLKRFDWHFNTHFQTDAFIYLVHQLQSESVGIKADTAWPQIFQAFDNRPEFLTNKNALYTAIQRLILKSWHAREIAFSKKGQLPPEGSPPNVILVLRSLRAGSSFSLNPSLQSLDSIPLATTSQDFNAQLEVDSFDPNLGLVDAPMDIDASNLDWSLWDDLIKS